MSRIVVRLIDSPVGLLEITATRTALCGLQFRGKRPPASTPAAPRHPVLDRAARQLEEYFAGHRREFVLPLAPEGTAFQRRVYRVLLAIPFGATRSYADVARAVGNARAVRAVGAANGRNPIAIVIPCHRVIGADGSLTGFGGGLGTKRWLLRHESRQAEQPLAPARPR